MTRANRLAGGVVFRFGHIFLRFCRDSESERSVRRAMLVRFKERRNDSLSGYCAAVPWSSAVGRRRRVSRRRLDAVSPSRSRFVVLRSAKTVSALSEFSHSTKFSQSLMNCVVSKGDAFSFARQLPDDSGSDFVRSRRTRRNRAFRASCRSANLMARPPTGRCNSCWRPVRGTGDRASFLQDRRVLTDRRGRQRNRLAPRRARLPPDLTPVDRVSGCAETRLASLSGAERLRNTKSSIYVEALVAPQDPESNWRRTMIASAQVAPTRPIPISGPRSRLPCALFHFILKDRFARRTDKARQFSRSSSSRPLRILEGRRFPGRLRRLR